VLGYAFVTLIYRSPARRVLFLLLCGGLFILANGVRAFGIIALDHLGVVEGADHRFFSYTVYSVTVFLLFRLGLRWEERAWFDSSDERPTKAGGRLPVRETALMAVVTMLILALAPASIWIIGGPR
jgi:exosortase/archaeosortase family protein